MHLLKIEWLKLKNYKTFWIILAMLAICIAGINYVYYQVVTSPGQAAGVANLLLGAPFRFPDVWHTITQVASYMLFIPSLLVIIVTTNEYNFKTHRQNVIDGLSRTAFILSKVLLIVVLSVVCLLVVFLTALIFGLSGEFSYFSMESSQYLLYYFLQCFTYMSFALLLSLLLKRSGLAIALFFVYTFMIENILVALINKAATGNVFQGPGYYFLLDASDKLIPIQSMQKLVDKNYLPTTINLLVTTFIYLGLFLFLSKKKFETADL
jgi:ABC-type transport system involved in multi-copper enzyme maturation permease subunit